MSHENAALVINQFMEIYKDTGLKPKIWDPDKIAIILDHRVPAESAKTATNQKKSGSLWLLRKLKSSMIFEATRAASATRFCPKMAMSCPGQCGRTDSHTTSHGALGAFSFGLGATEMAAVWALGRVLNVEVPKTIKVVAKGKFNPYVLPKDFILYLIGQLSAEGANFKVLEYHGPALERMSTSGRLTVANMSVEAGATSGIFPPDQETLRYLKEEAGVKGPVEIFGPDPEAEYDQVIEIDVSRLEPLVACPHTVDNVKPVKKLGRVKVNQIVIGSCTNGRLDDLAIAARILRGQKIARGVRMLVSRPPSGFISRLFSWAIWLP